MGRGLKCTKALSNQRDMTNEPEGNGFARIEKRGGPLEDSREQSEEDVNGVA